MCVYYTYIHVYLHTQTHTYVYIYIYIYIYIYTYTYIFPISPNLSLLLLIFHSPLSHTSLYLSYQQFCLCNTSVICFIINKLSVVVWPHLHSFPSFFISILPFHLILSILSVFTTLSFLALCMSFPQFIFVYIYAGVQHYSWSLKLYKIPYLKLIPFFVEMKNLMKCMTNFVLK